MRRKLAHLATAQVDPRALIALTDLQEGDRLSLKRSADAIRFVHAPGYSYFTMLREKLRWSNAVGTRPDD